MTVFRLKVTSLVATAPTVMAGSLCLAQTPSFSSGVTTGTIQNSAITEASGVAASRLNPNVLWTQEDSANPAQVYAMTPAGTNLGTYTLSGASNSDWEDIAVGPGPTAGAQYIYVGDIGDNNLVRSTIAVYRVPEPIVSDTQSPLTSSLSGASKFTLAYPDGAHDAESLFVDPLSKDIYIITKRDTTFKYVYRAAYPQSTSGTTTLALVASLLNSNALTAADISPDGSEIIIRSYATSSGLLYTRPGGGTVADAFATTPISIPLPSEDQGEAIGFDSQGRGYYTTSEGASQPIHYFDRLPPPAAAMYWDSDGVTAGNRLESGAAMGGSGTWNSSATNWYNGAANAPWQNGHDVVLWGSAGTVTLSSGQTVNSLTFKTSGYNITASTLTLAGSSVTVDANVTATISSIVAGSVGLVKNGAGTLVLTNSSNQNSGYTGGTIINAGTLNVASGTISHSGGAVTISNGSTLQFTGNFTLAAARSLTLGTGGGIIDTNGNTDTIAGAISGSSLTKTGAGTLVLSASNTYTGSTNVTVGTLILRQSLTSGLSLSIQNSAAAELTSGGNKIIATSSLTITPTGKLDLNDNKIVIDYSGASAAATIRLYLINGRGGTGLGSQTWAGSGGITSSAAANADPTGLAVGYREAQPPDFDVDAVTSFGGQTVDDTALLIRYTYSGDANLDGVVDRDDLNILSNSFGQPSGIDWLHGDFDYNGTCDRDDYNLLSNNFGTDPIPSSSMLTASFGSDFAASLAGSRAAAVPEPGPLVLLSAAGLAMLVRCRRRR